MDFLAELQTRVVLADGAMGTQLFAAGIPLDACLEEFNVTQPDLVARVHESYLAAGAEVIRTNSFGGNALRLARFGCERRVGELNWAAAQVARSCAQGKEARVAGSVGPLGVSLAEARGRGFDPGRLFADQLGALLDGGVQLVILETFTALDQLLVALEAKHTLHHCPVVCNVVCNEAGSLRDGTSLQEAFRQLAGAGADAVGVNCADVSRSLPGLLANVDAGVPLAAFPNAGAPNPTGNDVSGALSPDEFARLGSALKASGARLLGGCCGTTPEHLAALAATFPPSAL